VPAAVHPDFAPVAALFDRLMGGGPGGGALVVRRRGEVLVDVCAGSADRAGRVPWTRDTLGLSFSTTKGVSSTVIHRLAERGLLEYGSPVAAYWPGFAAGGKERITVADVLTHRAGLQDVRAVARIAEDLLDHELMESRLAARPSAGPTERSAYHGVTYGWLLSGIARRVSGGMGMSELFRDEIAHPLGLSGLHIGIDAGAGFTVGEPVGSALRHAHGATTVLGPVWQRVPATRSAITALLVPGFHRLFEGPTAPIWAAQMPAVSGAFTAEALARMYGALANGGSDDGRVLLRPETVGAVGRVQVRTADTVLGLRMRWRLGYHQAFSAGRQAPLAFGHYGYGGSGGWADPASGISVGFVTNRIGSVSTPLGDLNLPRLNRAIHACAAGR
jgi:CubicO group peptidase (beta-lactamase class C family)